MQEIAVSEFKAKCLAILKQVSKTKKPVRITRFGKPIAEIVPPSPARKGKSWLGFMAGTAEIVGDIVSPVIDLNEFEVFRDEAASRHAHLAVEHTGTKAASTPPPTRARQAHK